MDLNKQKIDKAYISEHDIFLHEFDKKHPTKSQSQMKEIEKHQRISAQRDEPQSQKQNPSFLKRILRVFISN